MKIAIDFGGWLTDDAKNFTFQAIEEGVEPLINGEEYANLPENEQSKYILESLSGQIKIAECLTFEFINIDVQ